MYVTKSFVRIHRHFGMSPGGTASRNAGVRIESTARAIWGLVSEIMEAWNSNVNYLFVWKGDQMNAIFRYPAEKVCDVFPLNCWNEMSLVLEIESEHYVKSRTLHSIRNKPVYMKSLMWRKLNIGVAYISNFRIMDFKFSMHGNSFTEQPFHFTDVRIGKWYTWRGIGKGRQSVLGLN